MKRPIRRRISLWKTALVAGFTCVFTASNVVWAYQIESSLWATRRKALDTRQNLPSLVDSLHHQIHPALKNKHTADFPLLSFIPQTHARIDKVVTQPGSNSPLKQLVILQDVHLNIEAQKNISQVIQSLNDNNQIGFVATEGAFEDFHFSPLRKVEQPQIVKEVADAFLSKELIGGPSYAAVTGLKSPPLFFGVDSKPDYIKNVKTYQQSLLSKAEIQKQFNRAKDSLEADIQISFNSKLKSFIQRLDQYNQNVTSLGSLISHIQLDTKENSLHVFKRAYDLEKTLDFNLVDEQRQRVFSKLASKMNEAETKNLVRMSLAAKTGKIDQAEFYSYLGKLLKKKKIEKHPFAEFYRYLTYISLADHISAVNLFADLDEAIETTLAGLIKTEHEKNGVRRWQYLGLVKKLVEFGLTSREWHTFSKYDDQNSFGPLLKPYMSFYKAADIRSEKMMVNLMDRVASLDKKQASTGVLFTGGFHTSLIEQELASHGISYAVVSPKISKVETSSGENYLSIFSREKTSLETLFEGKKLFMMPYNQLGTDHGQNVLFLSLAKAVSQLRQTPRNVVKVVVQWAGRTYRQAFRRLSSSDNDPNGIQVGETNITPVLTNESRNGFAGGFLKKHEVFADNLGWALHVMVLTGVPLFLLYGIDVSQTAKAWVGAFFMKEVVWAIILALAIRHISISFHEIGHYIKADRMNLLRTVDMRFLWYLRPKTEEQLIRSIGQEKFDQFKFGEFYKDGKLSTDLDPEDRKKFVDKLALQEIGYTPPIIEKITFWIWIFLIIPFGLFPAIKKSKGHWSTLWLRVSYEIQTRGSNIEIEAHGPRWSKWLSVLSLTPGVALYGGALIVSLLSLGSEHAGDIMGRIGQPLLALFWVNHLNAEADDDALRRAAKVRKERDARANAAKERAAKFEWDPAKIMKQMQRGYMFQYKRPDGKTMSIPWQFRNIVHGGEHAKSQGSTVSWQEFMITPLITQSMERRLKENEFDFLYNVLDELEDKVYRVQQRVQAIVQERDGLDFLGTGKEGGIVANFPGYEKQIMDIIQEAMLDEGYVPGEDFAFSLDIAASSMNEGLEPGQYKYYRRMHSDMYDADMLIDEYEAFADEYPIISIEDGMAEFDYEGWYKMNQRLGDRMRIVLDDVGVTNEDLLNKVVLEEVRDATGKITRQAQRVIDLGNTVLIKFNQIGTLSETLRVMALLSKQRKLGIISHRSGDTEDTHVVDLVLGVNGMGAKWGGAKGQERNVKWMTLLDKWRMFLDGEDWPSGKTNPDVKVKKVKAIPWKTNDGIPTVKVEIWLDNGMPPLWAAVPIGASAGSLEATHLTDKMISPRIRKKYPQLFTRKSLPPELTNLKHLDFHWEFKADVTEQDIIDLNDKEIKNIWDLANAKKGGKGVTNSVNYINNVLRHRLEGLTLHQLGNLEDLDRFLLAIEKQEAIEEGYLAEDHDHSSQVMAQQGKRARGMNTWLPLSLALGEAIAVRKGVNFYDLINDEFEDIKLDQRNRVNREKLYTDDPEYFESVRGELGLGAWHQRTHLLYSIVFLVSGGLSFFWNPSEIVFFLSILALIWGGSIGVQGALASLTKLFSPAKVKRDQSLIKNLEQKLQTDFPNVIVHPVRNAPKGWLEATDRSDRDNPQVFLASWLVAETDSAIFNFLRKLLLPLVLAHIHGRLGGQWTLSIYLQKPLFLLDSASHSFSQTYKHSIIIRSISYVFLGLLSMAGQGMVPVGLALTSPPESAEPSEPQLVYKPGDEGAIHVKNTGGKGSNLEKMFRNGDPGKIYRVLAPLMYDWHISNNKVRYKGRKRPMKEAIRMITMDLDASDAVARGKVEKQIEKWMEKSPLNEDHARAIDQAYFDLARDEVKIRINELLDFIASGIGPENKDQIIEARQMAEDINEDMPLEGWERWKPKANATIEKIRQHLNYAIENKMGPKDQDRIKDFLEGLGLDIDKGVKAFVRSTGVLEDLKYAAFPGQYETFGDIRGLEDEGEDEGIRTTTIRDWASNYTERVIGYRDEEILKQLARDERLKEHLPEFIKQLKQHNIVTSQFADFVQAFASNPTSTVESHFSSLRLLQWFEENQTQWTGKGKVLELLKEHRDYFIDPDQVQMAVILHVQSEGIDMERHPAARTPAANVFTVDTTTGFTGWVFGTDEERRPVKRSRLLYINSIYGLGEALVGGATGDADIYLAFDDDKGERQYVLIGQERGTKTVWTATQDNAAEALQMAQQALADSEVPKERGRLRSLIAGIKKAQKLSRKKKRKTVDAPVQADMKNLFALTDTEKLNLAKMADRSSDMYVLRTFLENLGQDKRIKLTRALRGAGINKRIVSLYKSFETDPWAVIPAGVNPLAPVWTWLYTKANKKWQKAFIPHLPMVVKDMETSLPSRLGVRNPIMIQSRDFAKYTDQLDPDKHVDQRTIADLDGLRAKGFIVTQTPRGHIKATPEKKGDERRVVTLIGDDVTSAISTSMVDTGLGRVLDRTSKVLPENQIKRGPNGEKIEFMLTEETAPEHLRAMQNSLGVVTDRGTKTSHAAIESLGMRIASVVGIQTFLDKLRTEDPDRAEWVELLLKTNGVPISVDGNNGYIYLAGDPFPALEKKLKEIKSETQRVKRIHELMRKYDSDKHAIAIPHKQLNIEIDLGRLPSLRRMVGWIISNAAEAWRATKIGLSKLSYSVALLRAEFSFGYIGIHPRAIIAHEVMVLLEAERLGELTDAEKTQLKYLRNWNAGNLNLWKSLQDDAETLKKHKDVIRQIDQRIEGYIPEGWKRASAMHFFKRSHAGNIGSIAAAYPWWKKKVYRFIDFKLREMKELTGGKVFFDELEEIDSMTGFRGSTYLLSPENLPTFVLELEVLADLSKQGIIVDPMFAFVRYPEQLEASIAVARSVYDKKGIKPRTLGMMIEIPTNVFEVDRFAKIMDDYAREIGIKWFFSYGTNDLSQGMFQFGRDVPILHETNLGKEVSEYTKNSPYVTKDDDGNYILRPYDEGRPEIFKAMYHVAKVAKKYERCDLSLCGEALNKLSGLSPALATKMAALLDAGGSSVLKFQDVLGVFAQAELDLGKINARARRRNQKKKIAYSKSSNKKQGAAARTLVYIEKLADMDNVAVGDFLFLTSDEAKAILSFLKKTDEESREQREKLKVTIQRAGGFVLIGKTKDNEILDRFTDHMNKPTLRFADRSFHALEALHLKTVTLDFEEGAIYEGKIKIDERELDEPDLIGNYLNTNVKNEKLDHLPIARFQASQAIQDQKIHPTLVQKFIEEAYQYGKIDPEQKGFQEFVELMKNSGNQWGEEEIGEKIQRQSPRFAKWPQNGAVASSGYSAADYLAEIFQQYFYRSFLAKAEDPRLNQPTLVFEMDNLRVMDYAELIGGEPHEPEETNSSLGLKGILRFISKDKADEEWMLLAQMKAAIRVHAKGHDVGFLVTESNVPELSAEARRLLEKAYQELLNENEISAKHLEGKIPFGIKIKAPSLVGNMENHANASQYDFVYLDHEEISINAQLSDPRNEILAKEENTPAHTLKRSADGMERIVRADVFHINQKAGRNGHKLSIAHEEPFNHQPSKYPSDKKQAGLAAAVLAPAVATVYGWRSNTYKWYVGFWGPLSETLIFVLLSVATHNILFVAFIFSLAHTPADVFEYFIERGKKVFEMKRSYSMTTGFRLVFRIIMGFAILLPFYIFENIFLAGFLSLGIHVFIGYGNIRLIGVKNDVEELFESELRQKYKRVSKRLGPGPDFVQKLALKQRIQDQLVTHIPTEQQILYVRSEEEAEQAMEILYDMKIWDERRPYLQIVNDDGNPVGLIGDESVLVNTNFRTDRKGPRERSYLEPGDEYYDPDQGIGFEKKDYNVKIIGATAALPDHEYPVAVEDKPAPNVFASVLNDHNIPVYLYAVGEKVAHVIKEFYRGGSQVPFPNERAFTEETPKVSEKTVAADRDKVLSQNMKPLVDLIIRNAKNPAGVTVVLENEQGALGGEIKEETDDFIVLRRLGNFTPYSKKDNKDAVLLIDFLALDEGAMRTVDLLRIPKNEIKLIRKDIDQQYSAHVVNFATPDLVAHAANEEWSLEALRWTEILTQELLRAFDREGVSGIFTGDHGNIEVLVDPLGRLHKGHSTNPVGVSIRKPGGEMHRLFSKTDGDLNHVMATQLQMMGVPVPDGKNKISLLDDKDFSIKPKEDGPQHVALTIYDGLAPPADPDDQTSPYNKADMPGVKKLFDTNGEAGRIGRLWAHGEFVGTRAPMGYTNQELADIIRKKQPSHIHLPVEGQYYTDIFTTNREETEHFIKEKLNDTNHIERLEKGEFKIIEINGFEEVALRLENNPYYNDKRFSIQGIRGGRLLILLDEGQIGGSEQGHTAMGVGAEAGSEEAKRPIMKLDEMMFGDDPAFFDEERNPVIKEIKENNQNGWEFHIDGMLQEAGVHASLLQLMAWVRLLHQLGVPSEKVFYHLMTDGRDEADDMGTFRLSELNELREELGGGERYGRIATIGPRINHERSVNIFSRLKIEYNVQTEGRIPPDVFFEVDDDKGEYDINGFTLERGRELLRYNDAAELDQEKAQAIERLWWLNRKLMIENIKTRDANVFLKESADAIENFQISNPGIRINPKYLVMGLIFVASAIALAASFYSAQAGMVAGSVMAAVAGMMVSQRHSGVDGDNSGSYVEKNHRSLIDKNVVEVTMEMAPTTGMLEGLAVLYEQIDEWKRDGVTAADVRRRVSMAQSTGGIGPLLPERIEALADLGLSIFGAVPLYQNVDLQTRDGVHLKLEPVEVAQYLRALLGVPVAEFKVKMFDGTEVEVKVLEAKYGKASVYFFDSEVFSSGYPGKRDAAKLGISERELQVRQQWVLGRGMLRLMKELDIQPHVIVQSEAPTAFAHPHLIQDEFQHDPYFADTMVVFNDHTPLGYAHPISAAYPSDQIDSKVPNQGEIHAIRDALGQHRISRDEVLAHEREAFNLRRYKIDPIYYMDQPVWVDTGLLGWDDPKYYEGIPINRNGIRYKVDLTKVLILAARGTFGVSKEHGRVMRNMEILRDVRGIIGDVTNGVLDRRWQAPEIRNLYHVRRADFDDREETEEQRVRKARVVLDGALHQELLAIKDKKRNELIDLIVNRPGSGKDAEWAERVRNQKLKFIMFDRRITNYKRFDLIIEMIMNPDLLKDFIESNNVAILGGRVHPNDRWAQTVVGILLQVLYAEPDQLEDISHLRHLATVNENPGLNENMIRDGLRRLREDQETLQKLRDRLVFFKDYNIDESPDIVKGVDGALMLADKGREASATGFQKVQMNGGVIITVPNEGAIPESVDFFDREEYENALAELNRIARTPGQEPKPGLYLKYLNAVGNGLNVGFNGQDVTSSGARPGPTARGLTDAVKFLGRIMNEGDPAANGDKLARPMMIRNAIAKTDFVSIYRSARETLRFLSKIAGRQHRNHDSYNEGFEIGKSVGQQAAGLGEKIKALQGQEPFIWNYSHQTYQTRYVTRAPGSKLKDLLSSFRQVVRVGWLGQWSMLYHSARDNGEEVDFVVWFEKLIAQDPSIAENAENSVLLDALGPLKKEIKKKVSLLDPYERAINRLYDDLENNATSKQHGKQLRIDIDRAEQSRVHRQEDVILEVYKIMGFFAGLISDSESEDGDSVSNESDAVQSPADDAKTDAPMNSDSPDAVSRRIGEIDSASGDAKSSVALSIVTDWLAAHPQGLAQLDASGISFDISNEPAFVDRIATDPFFAAQFNFLLRYIQSETTDSNLLSAYVNVVPENADIHGTEFHMIALKSTDIKSAHREVRQYLFAKGIREHFLGHSDRRRVTLGFILPPALQNHQEELEIGYRGEGLAFFNQSKLLSRRAMRRAISGFEKSRGQEFNHIRFLVPMGSSLNERFLRALSAFKKIDSRVQVYSVVAMALNLVLVRVKIQTLLEMQRFAQRVVDIQA